MKIAVFGASTSAQSVAHKTGEVTGYVEVLRRQFQKRLRATAIQQFCYPGNRLSDGGLVRIQDLLDWKPDLCIVEPLVEDYSRGRLASRDEILFIYDRLLSADILPVTFLLPYPARRTVDKWAGYKVVNEVCTSLGLPVIRVDLTGVEDMDAKFAGVHTTLAGAEIYARTFVRGMEERIGNLEALRQRLAPLKGRLQPRLHQARIAVPRPEEQRRMAFRMEATAAPVQLRLIQRQSIGVFSPMLQITLRPGDGGPDTVMQRSVWDPFCHYTRPSYVTLLDERLPADTALHIDIACSDEDPDYATCRREHIDFPRPEARHMKPMSDIHVLSDAPVRLVACD